MSGWNARGKNIAFNPSGPLHILIASRRHRLLLNHVTLFVHMFIKRHPSVPEVTDTYYEHAMSFTGTKREKERERSHRSVSS